MRSLRGRLTIWLLAGTGLLLAAGGLLLDRVIGARLLRGLDAALTEQAKSLQTSTEQEHGTVVLEFTPAAMPEFEPGKNPDYFEIWLRRRLASSRARASLGGPRPPALGRGPDGAPPFADFTLPDGRPGRRVEISFLPQVERPGDMRLRRRAPPGSPTVTLVVAQSREDLDAFLASLHLTLALFVLGLLAGMAILVKIGGRPRPEAARRARAAGWRTMDAGSLGETVVIADAPAELASTIGHLNGLLARLGESFERERTFSANLAHEMRTPLAELRAVTEVALKWPEDSAALLGTLDEIRGIGLQMERWSSTSSPSPAATAASRRRRASRLSLRELAAECWSAVAAEADGRGIRARPARSRRTSPWSPTARSWG